MIRGLGLFAIRVEKAIWSKELKASVDYSTPTGDKLTTIVVVA